MNQPNAIQTENGFQCGNLAVENLPKCQALVLMFCALGLSEKKIAIVMGCSQGNIKQAKQNLFFKLRANNTTEAVAKAFAAAYLRALSLLIALFIGTAATTIADNHNAMARLNRTRPSSNLRARNSAKPRPGNGLYWDSETNELVWS